MTRNRCGNNVIMTKKTLGTLAIAATLAGGVVAPASAESPAPTQSSSADEFFYESDGETLTPGGTAVIAVSSIAAILGLLAAGGAWSVSQGMLPNPFAPAPAPPAPAPAPQAPMYNDLCTENQVLQPTVGADGSNLVCVYGGRDFRWVYGPKPRGVGTAHQGGYCDADGGQDDQGRMMMCLNNQWIYGP